LPVGLNEECLISFLVTRFFLGTSDSDLATQGICFVVPLTLPAANRRVTGSEKIKDNAS